MKRARAGMDESDVGPGSVVRPGASLSLVRVQSPLIDSALMRTLAKRVALNVCYCSILQQCWTVSESRAGPPQAVHDCGPPGAALTY